MSQVGGKSDGDSENDPSVLPEYLHKDFDASMQTIPRLMQILTMCNVELPVTKQRKDVYIQLFQDEVQSKRTKIISDLNRKKQAAKKSSSSLFVDVEALKAKRRKSIVETPVKRGSEENPFQSNSASPAAVDVASASSKRRKSMVSDALNGLKNVKSSMPSPLPFMFKMPKTPPDVKFSESDEPPAFNSPPSQTGCLTTPKTARKSSRSKESAGRSLLQSSSFHVVSTGLLADSFAVASDVTDHGSLTDCNRMDSDLAVQDSTTAATVYTRQASKPIKPSLDSTPLKQTTATPSKFLNVSALTPRISYTQQKPSTLPPAFGPEFINKSIVFQDEKTQAGTAGLIIYFYLKIALVLLAGMVAQWFIEVKDSVSYCDGTRNSEYTGLNPLGKLLPMCVRCPMNAVCVDKTVVSCDDPQLTLKRSLVQRLASRLAPHLELPILLATPKCVPDKHKKFIKSKRKQRTDHLIAIINENVKSWTGRAQCGQLKEHLNEYPFVVGTGKQQVLGMPMSLVKDGLWAKVSSKWTEQEFEGYWEDVLERVLGESGTLGLILDDSGVHRLFTSTDAPILSVGCRLRRSFWETIKGHSTELSMSGIAILVVLFMWSHRQSSQQEARKVYILVHDILEMIHEEAENHLTDTLRHPIPGLAVSQLRDYLLLEFLPQNANTVFGGNAIVDKRGRTRWLVADKKMRERLWSKTRTILLRNSNIRETLMELKGDQYNVWQWVGSSALSPRK